MTARILNIEQAAAFLATMVAADAVSDALTERELPTPEGGMKSACELLLRTSGCRSQGDVAALAVNLTHGAGASVDADAITKLLVEAFPGANIGKRHGPHYLSLARSGKLKGLKADMAPIPHQRKARKAVSDKEAESASPESSDTTKTGPEPVDKDALREELKALKRTPLVQRAKDAGVKASGKSEAIIARIIAAA